VDEATRGDEQIVGEDEPTTGGDEMTERVVPATGGDEATTGGELGFGAGAELGSGAGAELGFGAGAEVGSGAGAELAFGAGAGLGSGAGAGLGFGAAGDAGGASGEAGDFAGGAAAEVGIVDHKGERKTEGGYISKFRKKRGAGARITSPRQISNAGGMAVPWCCQCPSYKSEEGSSIASNAKDNPLMGWTQGHFQV
jgi:hypothetical protein